MKPRNRSKMLKRLGENLRYERIRANLTQAELADKIGAVHVRISELERGLENPTLERLVDLSRALGVELSRLTETCDRN